MRCGSLAALFVAGTASVIAPSTMAAPKTAAPQPAKLIDPMQFYHGRWYEIARTPTKLTDDCVAGATDFLPNVNGGVDEVDSCRLQKRGGKEKVFSGPVTILDPGQNNKISIAYRAFGFFPMNRRYWILDRGADYGWFIVSDPDFKTVGILSRKPRPDQSEVRRLVARLGQLGYNVKQLEFPTPAPGS